MLDESLLDRELKRLDRKWYQSDRKYRWMLTEENGTPYIKRNIKTAAGKKTFQRLPRKIYRHLSKTEMEDLIIRLNYYEAREKRARERYKVKCAFIQEQHLKEFHEQLESEIPTPEVVQANFSNLRKHFLNFFDPLAPDPKDWHRHHQIKWADYLFKTGLSPKGLRSIIQISNRFMKYMHKKRPDEIPLLEFKPITKARFRVFQAKWVESEKSKKRHYISEVDYHKIHKTIPNEIKSIFVLCYKFGLRRGEAMALHDRLDCVKKECLYINQQLKRYTREQKKITGPTKGRLARKVPYWNSSPQEAYELIKAMEVMCPDEASRKFSDHCKSLKMNYTLHDCRHTFITDAVNKKGSELNTIKLAVGHRDLRVTSSYLRDNTSYDDDVWTPEITEDKAEAS